MGKLKFKHAELSEEIKKAISDMGFEEASPIQSQAIPYILEGNDLIGQAQTGTGKTAAFGIPILENCEAENRQLQAIVLCPTRELSIQVAEEIRKLSKYKKDIYVLPVYGGQPIERQIKGLKRGVQIVIGTPGRVLDHLRRHTLKPKSIKMVVFDEADEMFDMGFRDDIENILNQMPKERQTIFFSATMPKEIMNFAKKYQNSPKIVKVVHKELTVPKVEQYYFELKNNMKTEILSRLIDIHNPKLSLVFCNTKKKVDELVMELQGRGYFADGLHGDLKQTQRDKVMSSFRKGNIDILVATDVAARGIDVGDVDLVLNYDIPQDEEYYVHRIGRTARAGRSGKAFSFVAGKDIHKLRTIQKYTNTKIIKQNLPTLGDVEEKRMDILLEKIRSELEAKEFSKHENIINILLEEDYNSFDIASAILKLYVEDNKKDGHEQIDLEKINNGADLGMTRLFINMGKKQKISPRHIIGAITNKTNLSRNHIGKIDIYDKFSFVEIPEEDTNKVLKGLKNYRIKGKKMNVEIANPR
ncbi:DEAD/DEAH box helicase [Anaerosalibacter massiliensis]|uniref:ATP-dependent RNA helicase CshA n=1 Tax=Anaerosalibacter massiliensis TaxID=1347392 RepID=A0A9X2MH69_9FIRM|nr:DEAD/DEAH box helicase [Anaerosalibacter massiliensis]MCR2043614.1 DEAD/DEAH box helicase [Anaerosalibacter massiliensis]